MAATFTHAQSDRPLLGSSISWGWLDRAVECFWFSLCLILFMLLGPFSAPIVLGYIFFGKLNDHAHSEPELVSETRQ